MASATFYKGQSHVGDSPQPVSALHGPGRADHRALALGRHRVRSVEPAHGDRRDFGRHSPRSFASRVRQPACARRFVSQGVDAAARHDQPDRPRAVHVSHRARARSQASSRPSAHLRRHQSLEHHRALRARRSARIVSVPARFSARRAVRLVRPFHGRIHEHHGLPRPGTQP